MKCFRVFIWELWLDVKMEIIRIKSTEPVHEKNPTGINNKFLRIFYHDIKQPSIYSQINNALINTKIMYLTVFSTG